MLSHSQTEEKAAASGILLKYFVKMFPSFVTQLNNQTLSADRMVAAFEAMKPCSIKRIIEHIRKEDSLRKSVEKGISFMRPMMKHREIDVIEEILINKKPKMCLEWGSGYSTLYFPKMLDDRAKWFSIEHDTDWYGKISNLVSIAGKEALAGLEKVSHYNIKPDDPSLKGSCYGGTNGYDFRTYIHFPEQLGKFDFILVDGRRRVRCLLAASQMIKDDGIVILHDANVSRYHEPFCLFNNKCQFKDLRKNLAGGIWVGSKSQKVEDIINVRAHQEYWTDICMLNEAFYHEGLAKNTDYRTLFYSDDLFNAIDNAYL